MTQAEAERLLKIELDAGISTLVDENALAFWIISLMHQKPYLFDFRVRGDKYQWAMGTLTPYFNLRKRRS